MVIGCSVVFPFLDDLESVVGERHAIWTAVKEPSSERPLVPVLVWVELH